MIIGEVIGNVWATRKQDGLTGLKLMIVKPFNYEGKYENINPIIAADTIGAGVGEKVLVVTGTAARMVLDGENNPVDASIVGIIDEIDIHS